MPFVNEKISPVDRAAFNIEQHDRLPDVRTPGRYWTIDRDKPSYLRYVGGGHEGERELEYWHFYWKNRLIHIRSKITHRVGRLNEDIAVRRQILRMSSDSSLDFSDQELTSDLYAAFLAYKDFGFLSEARSFKLILDF
jgi:hypothetical protein